ncbi:MAG TPA: iron-containing alcohol dehydrogenase [Candidatus Methylomirabilis sp.]|nr:iron-containing alcohol dehydrogenase [Candidatus Methylomirabilis sp.]HSB82568.1 iron-containing alcohol dehydrogenase [Candidatus Methylomirabilis sp.]
MSQEFRCPPRIITGDGSADSVGTEAEALGATRAVVVTDKTLHEKTDFISDAVASLKRAGLAVEVFDDVEPDPMVATARSSAEFAREYVPNLVVGLGGGSALDIAKATAAILANERPLEEMWGVDNVPKPGLPMILMPTTAGTGSEVTPNSILTDVKPDGGHTKKGIVSAHLLARAAIVDPLLTVTAPPAVTASAGMDALTHAIETYVSRSAQPLTRPLALEAIRLIGASLRRAVADGRDVEARRHMANASLMAGLAFANGLLGAVHAIAMAMGGRFGVSHGVANALMLPYVMEFNETAVQAEYAQIAKAMGEDVAGLPPEQAAHLASVAVHRLVVEVGLPHTLSDVKIPREGIAGLAEESFGNQRLLKNNPRAATVQDITGILEAASGARR